MKRETEWNLSNGVKAKVFGSAVSRIYVCFYIICALQIYRTCLIFVDILGGKSQDIPGEGIYGQQQTVIQSLENINFDRRVGCMNFLAMKTNLAHFVK